MIVRKFGGTSVADASALRAVLSICTDNSTIATQSKTDRQTTTATSRAAQLVVLSATSGTTNLLFALARAACADNHSEMRDILLRVRDKHLQILEDAGIGGNVEVDNTLQELSRFANGIALLGECTDQSLDMMVSFGEMLSTKIFVAMCVAAGLDATWFDVRTVLRTDTRFTSAAAQLGAIQPLAEAHLEPLLVPGAIVVTQGYIGETADGRTTTLGRGGSDYSAAILGSVLGADEIQIWTDVSGVYSADPRQISDARPIPHLSFHEVRELALYGAKVLHPGTILPAIERSIPVRILNTFRPTDIGTLITAAQPLDADIHAVTALKNCIHVAVNSSASKLPSIHKLIEQSVLHLVSLDAHVLVICVPDEATRVDVEVALAGVQHEAIDVSIIAACGPMASSAGILSRITKALAEIDIVAMMTGPSALSVFIVCREHDAPQALNAIHSLLLSEASSSRN